MARDTWGFLFSSSAMGLLHTAMALTLLVGTVRLDNTSFKLSPTVFVSLQSVLVGLECIAWVSIWFYRKMGSPDGQRPDNRVDMQCAYFIIHYMESMVADVLTLAMVTFYHN